MIFHSKPLNYQVIIDTMNIVHEWMTLPGHDDYQLLEFSPYSVPVSVSRRVKPEQEPEDISDDEWVQTLLKSYSGAYFVVTRKQGEYLVARNGKILQMKDLNLTGFHEMFDYMSWGDMAICDTRFCVPLLVALDLANTGIDFNVSSHNQAFVDGL